MATSAARDSDEARHRAFFAPFLGPSDVGCILETTGAERTAWFEYELTVEPSGG
ncbi:MAG TPA: hypothetical protein VNC61_13735 [Acidimicrobiales bacterium]|nr:hypothetical protein [Acidimicrobiales bacterium]